ncbi:MAG: DNA-3-methyladenine glycosylase I [Clostridia bacterium]|nr:DNA-3-methyladenine glycosylase I [Clostridia bacterium]
MSYCNWASGERILEEYHETEWGIPIFDDVSHFECLMLEAMQCGLSWLTVMKKREIFRASFDGFDFERVAKYTEADVERIMNTEGMLRSCPKIRAVRSNAKKFLEIRAEFGSFSEYIWRYKDGKTVIYDGNHDGYIPNSNGLSDEISKGLKKRGFKYIGSVTVYSYLQASGIINDHGKDCPRFAYINERFDTVKKPPCNDHNVIKYK